MTFPLKDTPLFLASIDIRLLESSSAASEISLGVAYDYEDNSSSVYSLI